MKKSTHKYGQLAILLTIAVINTGCLIEDVVQPAQVDAGSTFTTTVTVSNALAENATAHNGAMAVMVPDDWTYTSGSYITTSATVANGVVFSGPFDGTVVDGNTYTFPTGAQPWAGFANQDVTIYPLSFPNGGTISFTGATATFGTDVNVYFRFEFNPYPDAEPSFNTAAVTVSDTAETSYSVDIPAQGANTYSSFILYVTTPDAPVTLTNVNVWSVGVSGEMLADTDNGSVWLTQGDGYGGSLPVDINTFFTTPDNMQWVYLLSDQGGLTDAGVEHAVTLNFGVGSTSGIYSLGYVATYNSANMMDYINNDDEDDTGVGWVYAGVDTSFNHPVEVVSTASDNVPENWNVNSSALTVEQETTIFNEGASSAKATWTSTSNQDLDSDEFALTGGTDFSLVVDVNDNDTGGRVRLAVDWDAGSNSYGDYSVDQEGWQTVTFTGSIPSDATTAHVKLRFYDVSSGWDGDAVLYIDNVSFTENGGDNLVLNGGFETWVAPPQATAYTIVEIQTPGADGDASQHEDELVETSGTVTAVGSYFYFMQDGSSEYSGVYVYNSPGDLSEGDDITITGTVTEFSGLTQIASVTETVVSSTGNSLPAAVTLTTGEVNTEPWEGVLVNTSGTCDNDDLGNGEWSIDDGTGSVRTDDAIFEFVATISFDYDVTGPLLYNYGYYKILPRSADDVVETATTGGCTDPTAVNYDADADYDDGSCYYQGDVCESPLDAVAGSNDATGADQFFSYTATVNGTMTVSSDGSGEDTYLVVLGSCDVVDGYYADVIGSHDDIDYPANTSSELTFDVTLGATYIILWDESWGPGPFTWTLIEDDTPTTPFDLTADAYAGDILLTWQAIPEDDGTRNSGSAGQITHLKTRVDASAKRKDSPLAVRKAPSPAQRIHYRTYSSNNSRTEDFTVVLYDSYSDGWCWASSCNSLTVAVNGTDVLTEITLESGGTSDPFAFAVDNGDEIYITFNENASYASENSYEVFDHMGNSVAASGAVDLSFTVQISADVAGCMTAEACNYNADATEDDGSCCLTNCTTVAMGGGTWITETSWEITDAAGNIVASGDGVASSEFSCFDDGDYTATGWDSYGDGWSGNVLTVTGDAGEAWLSFTLESGTEGTATFTVGGDVPVPGCIDPEANNYDPDATTDDGSCTYNYQVCETTDLVGAVGTNSHPGGEAWYSFDVTESGYLTVTFPEFEVIQVVGVCGITGGYFDDYISGFYTSGSILFGADGTTYYGDPTSDYIGTTVHIRIAGSYNTDPVDFEIGWTTVVEGCMNPQASNYDPDANYDDGSCEYLPCETGEYIMSMYDSYGDGWSGNTYTITDPEGGLYALGGLESGAFDADTLCLADGIYNLVVDGGIWQGEVSWTLTQMNGALVAEGGAPYNEDFAVPLTLTFNVYRGGVLLASDVEGTALIDNTVDPEVEYCYTVTQDLDDDTESGASNEACATVELGSACSVALSAVMGTNSTESAPMWYSYTAGLTGVATVSSEGTTVDTKVEVYSDCDGAFIGEDDDDGTGLSSVFSWEVTIGSTYYIYWSGNWNDEDPFDWTLDEYDPTVVELTATAGIASVELEWTSIDTVYWTPGGLMAQGNEGNMVINLFDPPKPDAEKYASYFPYIQEDYPDRTRQGGDTFDDATVIAAIPYNIFGTTAGYADDYDEVCISASTSPDVVYSYTPSDDNYININTCGAGSAYDTKLFVYDEAMNSLACNDDACANDTQSYLSSIVDMPVLAGTTYYIVVDGWGGESGEYELNVTQGTAPPEPPANDLCENAIPVSSGDEVTGTTEGATPDISSMGDVWYAVDLPNALNLVTMSLCNSAQAIGTGFSVAAYSCEDVADANWVTADAFEWYECANITYAPTATWTFEGPGTAYIPVITQSSAGTEFGPEFVATFSVDPIYVPTFNVYRDGATEPTYAGVSGNELVDFDVTEEVEACYTVTQIMPDDSEYGESNQACATPLATPPGYDCEHAITAVAGENNADGQPMWYEYTATLDGFLTISSQNETGDATWDTYLYVFNSCDATTAIDAVAENDDCCDYFGPSTVTLEVQTGEIFKIFWDDNWGTSAFTFTIEEILPADIYPPSLFMAEAGWQRVDLSWSYPVPPGTAAGNSEGGATENFVPVINSDYDQVKREYYREAYEGGSSRDLSGSDVTVLTSIDNGDGTADIVFNILIDSPDISWSDGCQLTFPEGITINAAGSSEECGDAVIDGQTVTWGDVEDPETGSGYGCFTDEHLVGVTVSTYEAEIEVGWYLADDCYQSCGDLEGTATAPVPTVMEDCEDDVFEPNDAFAEATVISASDTVTGLTICIDDVDWYTSELQSHGSFSITMLDTTGSMGLFFWDLSVSGYSILDASGNDTLSLSYTNLGDDTTTIVWWYGVADYYNPLAQSSYTMAVVYEDPIDYTYNLYYSDGTLIDDTTGYAYAVLGLVNGTEYSFYATSVDAEGNESAPTQTVSATPVADDIRPPENLQGQAGVETASLMWDPPSPAAQPGDNIEMAWEVDPAFPIELLGTTEDFMDDYDETCPYTGSGAPEVVYSLTPSADITVDIDLCGSDYDTKAYVYEDEYTPGEPYACDDDGNYNNGTCTDGVNQWTSVMLGVELYAGSTYYIVVDGYGGASNFGNYVVDITESTGRISGNNDEIDTRAVLQLKNEAPIERNTSRTNNRDLLGYAVHRAIGDGGFVPIDTVGETTYLDTGLTADIAHHYQVTGVYNDGESTPAGPVTVVPVAPIDLPVVTDLIGEADGWTADLTWTNPLGEGGASEDFEDGELPDDWSMTTLAEDCYDYYNNNWAGWIVTMDGSSAWFTVPAGDGYYAVSNDDQCNGDGSMDYLYMPEADFSGGALALTFRSFFNGSYSQTAHIGVSVDGGVSWVEVATLEGNSVWVDEYVDLSAYNGEESVQIVFWSNDNGAWASGWAVDNVALASPQDLFLDHYNVYRGLMGSEELIGESMIEQFSEFQTDSGTYTYSVTAVYEIYGESGPSNYVDVGLPSAPACNPPRNLVAQSNSNDVSLSWEAPEGGPGWNLHHDSGEYGTAIGSTAGAADFTVAARFGPQHLMDYNGMALTKVQFMPNEPSASYQVHVWTSAVDGEPTLIDTSEWISGYDMDMQMYNVVELAEGIEIDWATELWFGYRVVTPMGSPAGTDPGPAVPDYGAKMLWDGIWYNLTDLAPSLDYNWAIQGFVDLSGGGRSIASMPTIDLSGIPRKVTSAEGTFSHMGVVLPPSNQVNTTRVMTNYIVYRDGEALDTTGVDAAMYNDNDAPWGPHAYYVTALYNNSEDCGESDPSNTVEVDLFNNPPGPFILQGPPANGMTLVVTESNLGDVFPIIWTTSTDPDNDPVSYVVVATDTAGVKYDTTSAQSGMFLTNEAMTGNQFEDTVAVMTYLWDVWAHDPWDSTSSDNGPWTLIVDISAILALDDISLPEVFALHNNYPNPFNPVTNISYDIPEVAQVTLDVYNIAGQKVRTLAQGLHEPGRYRIQWNATNDYGKPLSSGMYIYRIHAGDFVSVKKLILMK